MPVCLLNSAWVLAALRSVCSRQLFLYHSVPFNRVKIATTTPGTRLDFTSRFCSDFDVQVAGKSSMSSPAMSQRMVWVDLEMTGLDIEKDKIIEMACIITDSDLNILAEGPNLIINQPDELLDGMSEWCKEHHGKLAVLSSSANSSSRFCFFQYLILF
eukprot:superscaffoldBa00003537_g17166